MISLVEGARKLGIIDVLCWAAGIIAAHEAAVRSTTDLVSS